MLAELMLAAVLQADATVKNPRGVGFTCADHAADDAHEVQIVRASDGAVIQTIAGGDPAAVAGEVVIPINVQPVAFGLYRFRVRALAGGLASDWAESQVWERVPGAPTNVIAR